MSYPKLNIANKSPVTLSFKSRDSYYADKTPKTMTFKDEYAAQVFLSSFSCRDSRWRPESVSIRRSNGC